MNGKRVVGVLMLVWMTLTCGCAGTKGAHDVRVTYEALEETDNGRFLVDSEKKGRPSKWVTLNALRALKAHHSPAASTK